MPPETLPPLTLLDRPLAPPDAPPELLLLEETPPLLVLALPVVLVVFTVLPLPPVVELVVLVVIDPVVLLVPPAPHTAWMVTLLVTVIDVGLVVLTAAPDASTHEINASGGEGSTVRVTTVEVG